jgi:hypothetical protein
MAEAAVASSALIQDHSGGSATQDVSWSLKYSERDWTFEAKGAELEFLITGYLWGQDDESWMINYSGLGSVDGEPLRIYGQADWEFDKEASDYRHINFRQVMKFGEHTFWGWVLGTETIVGGTIGAGGALAGAAVATGGVALGAAPWIAAAGAVSGLSALVGTSLAAKSLLDSNEPPPPPPTPQAPAPPAAGSKLVPSEGTILTAVSRDGRIFASGPGKQILEGASKWDSSELGFASGSIGAF